MYIFYYTFACFIKILIGSCKTNKSNEYFMKELFKEYFEEPTEHDVDKHTVLNKSVVSKIINYHRKLPKAIAYILEDNNYNEKIKLAINKFIEKHIDIRLIDNLINQLEDKISKAENINQDEKEHIENLKTKLEEDIRNFINKAFKIILDKENEINITILSNEDISKTIKNIVFNNNKKKNKIKSDIKFIEKNRSRILIDNLINKIEDQILQSKNTDKQEKEDVKNLKTKIKEDQINFIFEAFKIALNHDNKIDDKIDNKRENKIDYTEYLKYIFKYYLEKFKSIS